MSTTRVSSSGAMPTRRTVERVRPKSLTVLFGRSGLGQDLALACWGLRPAPGRRSPADPVRLDFSERRRYAGCPGRPRSSRSSSAQAVEAAPPGASRASGNTSMRPISGARAHRLLTPVLVDDQFEELFTLGQGDGRIGPSSSPSWPISSRASSRLRCGTHRGERRAARLRLRAAKLPGRRQPARGLSPRSRGLRGPIPPWGATA